MDATGPGAAAPAGGTDDSLVPPGSRARRFLRRIGHRRLLVGGVLAAVAARLPLLSHESLDFTTAYSHWYDFIAANGHFAALRYDFAVYAPAHLTLLAGAVSFLPELPKVLAVKAVPLPFDFLLAFFAYRCVGLRTPDSKEIPVLAALAVLFTPTVLLNGALLAQADAIYTSFLVGGLSFLLAGRRRAAFALFGAAFGFKAQAVFLAPLLLCLFRKRTAGLRDLGWSALAFFGTLLPAWFLGRPLGEMLSIYLRQGSVYRELTMGAANLWQWVPNDLYPFWPLGALFTVALVWGLAVLVEKSRVVLTPDRIVFLAAFSVLVVPFFLPKMLDRYFFPAEVFAVVLAFYRPRLWFAPVILGLTGLNFCLANGGVGFASPVLPYPGAAGVHLGLVGALAWFLFRDPGYSLRLRDLTASLRKWAGARGAAAAPLLLLLGALAAVLSFAGAAGRFDRPFGGDPAETRTLAAAANLSADPSPLPFPARALSGFTGREPDVSGEVAYAFAGPPPPPAGHLLLGWVVGHFGSGAENALAAQLLAARVLMALLFAGAALLACLSLGRLLGNRWLAAGATLLAFSGFLGGGWDRVSLEGAPALFGMFLAFHGLVVFAAGGFRREGRRPALLRCGAGLLFGFGAGALLVAFAAVGLLSELLLRRRVGSGSARPGAAGSGSAASAGAGGAPGADAGPRRPGERESWRAFAFLGAFALAVGGGVFGVGIASRAALPGGAAEPTAGRTTLPASDRSAAGEGSAPPPSFPERALGGAARVLVPHALPDSAGGRRFGRAELTAAVALLTLGGLVGAAFSRRRLLLLPLALAGGGGAFLGEAAGGVPGAGAALHPGLAVVLAALLAAVLAAALRRLPGAAGSRVLPFLFVVPAAAVFLWSGYRAARAESPAGSPAPSAAGAAVLRGPVGEDLQRVRRRLARRVWHRSDLAGRFSTRTPRPGGGALLLEEQTVFVPPGSFPGAEAAAWFFAGSVVAVREEQRRFAGFVVASESRPGRGLLTPENETVFLHHRTAYDGQVDALIAAAGAPLVRGPFALHRSGGRLLYVREDCRPEDLEARFFLHLEAQDDRDLPPYRRPHGFDNLDFRFHDRLIEDGGGGGVVSPACACRTIPSAPWRPASSSGMERAG